MISSAQYHETRGARWVLGPIDPNSSGIIQPEAAMLNDFIPIIVGSFPPGRNNSDNWLCSPGCPCLQNVSYIGASERSSLQERAMPLNESKQNLSPKWSDMMRLGASAFVPASADQATRDDAYTQEIERLTNLVGFADAYLALAMEDV